MGLLDKIKQVPAVYAREGIGGIGQSLAARIYERTEFIVLQRDLRQPPLPARCTLSFRLRRVDDAWFERFREMPEPFPRHFQYRALYGMRHCYAAWVGDEISALMWPVFQADNARLVTRWRYLLPDEARLASIWVSPACRGTGLIDTCYARFEAICGNAGFRYFYTCTWVGNHGSRKLSLRRGFIEVATVTRYSFRWQQEGRGLYIRQPVPREALAAAHHPGGDMDLPDEID